MGGKLEAVVVSAADRRQERFEEPERGEATWRTLVSGDFSPSARLSAGIFELPPNGVLAAHRHAEAELYFVHDGAGVVTIDGVASRLAVGVTVFIPGDAEHSVRNDTDKPLTVFYVFPTDRFSDVVYRFSA